MASLRQLGLPSNGAAGMATGMRPGIPRAARGAAFAVGAFLLTCTFTTSAATGDDPVLEGTWRDIAEAPFGSTSAAAAWTGSQVVVVDLPIGGPSRAAAYDPAADAWTELDPLSQALDVNSPSVWTGEELLVFDHAGMGTYALDPLAGTWRTLAPLPIEWPRYAAWIDGMAIVGASDRSVARYELASDTWTELPKVPGAPVLEGLSVVGDSILGDTHPDDPGPASIAALDRTSWTWGEPSVGPLRTLSSGYGAAIDGELLYALGGSGSDEWMGDAAYDPVTGAWSERDFDCPVSSGWSTWTGTLLIDSRYALDPVSGSCYEIADPENVRVSYEAILCTDGNPGGLKPSACEQLRSPAALVWAGDRLFEWSGWGGESPVPIDARGITFTPSA